VQKLTAREGFRCLVLSLWDPDQRCYVPFPEWAWLDRLLTGPDTIIEGYPVCAQPESNHLVTAILCISEHLGTVVTNSCYRQCLKRACRCA
jgi:hypothetical protein